MNRLKTASWWIAAVGLAAACGFIAFYLFPEENYSRNDAEQIVHISNARTLSAATLLYTTDNDETFPPATDQEAFAKKLKPYVKKVANPAGTPLSSEDGALLFTQLSFNVTLSETALYRITDPSKQAMLYDSLPISNGSRVVAFANGSLAIVSSADWWDMLLGMKPTLLPEGLAKVRRLGQAMSDYLSAHGNRFPTVADMAGLKAQMGYMAPNPVWSTKSGDVQFNFRLSGQVATGVQGAKQVPEFVVAGVDGDYAVWFVDGHVEEVTAKRWQSLNPSFLGNASPTVSVSVHQPRPAGNRRDLPR